MISSHIFDCDAKVILFWPINPHFVKMSMNNLASLSGLNLLPPSVETAGKLIAQSASQHFSPSTQKTYSWPSDKALNASVYL